MKGVSFVGARLPKPKAPRPYFVIPNRPHFGRVRNLLVPSVWGAHPLPLLQWVVSPWARPCSAGFRAFCEILQLCAAGCFAFRRHPERSVFRERRISPRVFAFDGCPSGVYPGDFNRGACEGVGTLTSRRELRLRRQIVLLVWRRVSRSRRNSAAVRFLVPDNLA